MPLLEYIVKLLAGSSTSLILGIIILIFGYYGWLLWNMNEMLKKYFASWNEHDEHLDEINKKFNDFDDIMYRELAAKIAENINRIETLNEAVRDNNRDLERGRKDILDEIKESTAELKDLIMILINNRSARGIKNKNKGVPVDNDQSKKDSKKEEAAEKEKD